MSHQCPGFPQRPAGTGGKALSARALNPISMATCGHKGLKGWAGCCSERLGGEGAFVFHGDRARGVRGCSPPGPAGALQAVPSAPRPAPARTAPGPLAHPRGQSTGHGVNQSWAGLQRVSG